MKSPSFSLNFYTIRLGLGLLTVLCLWASHYIPSRTYQIFPSKNVTIGAYADSVAGGNSKATWLNKDRHIVECDLMPGVGYPYCGVSIKFFGFEPKQKVVSDGEGYSYQRLRSIDLSGYDSLVLNIDYAGNASGLRLFIRNALHMPKNFAEYNAQQFIYQNLAKRELGQPITIALNDLKMADWWIDKYRVDRKNASVALDKVFEVGIDFPGNSPTGKHIITINSITAVGKWVSDATLYAFILALWLISIIFEGGYRIFRLRGLNRQFKLSLSELQNENSGLRRTAETDVLTGLYNRTGLNALMAKVFPAQDDGEFSLVIIDLDYFKRVNDQCGHIMGDRVLQKVGEAIYETLRSGDILGRWGGEEFLLLTSASGDSLAQLMHRINSVVAAIHLSFKNADFPHITVSMGTTKARKGEVLEQTFARADKALYEAKTAGRNTWRVK